MPTISEPTISIELAQAIGDTLNTLTPAHRWEVRPARADQSPWEQARSQCLEYAGTDPLLQGAALYLDTRQARGRLECYGHRHGRHADGGPYGEFLGNLLRDADRKNLCTTITVSLEKTPARIARDLVTRLLPLYLDGYRKAMEALQGYATAMAQQNALAHQLAATLGPGARVTERKELASEAVVHFVRPGVPSVTFRVYTDSVRLEYMSMSPMQVQAFAALLASWGPTAPAKGQHVDVRG